MDSADTTSILLLILIALAALLYSSVGHGGASGYLAVMALLGVAPAVMKPAALVLNIFVAGLVFVRLYRAGYFNAPLFWPFALGSIPLAFVGGLL
ncbi:MAG: sulfite exporter TauE/SafE family protein, partial [Pseudomonadota bacterium]